MVNCTKAIQGKRNNFFHGFRASGKTEDSDVIHPFDCEINFVVPSDPILAKESSKFSLDASKLGILQLSLDAFTSQHRGEDVNRIWQDGQRRS